MAAPEPGFAMMPAAEDPRKGGLELSGTPEDEQPVAPDQFDPKYETTRWEIWSYYAYYIGDNGLTLFNFAPTAFQNLLYQAAGDSPTLLFLGSQRTINSIVLLSNGISFAIQIVIFLIIGSYAGETLSCQELLTIEAVLLGERLLKFRSPDFGRSRPNILIASSILAFAIGFAWLGVHSPEKWEAATGLYIVGLIAYQSTITFWTAAFPSLARNTPVLRVKAAEYTAGAIARADYDFADMMQRSRLANMAFYIQSLGEIVILAVIVGVMYAVDVNASVEANNWGLSVLIAFATGVWVLLALPWFVVEKRRPGQDAPRGMNV